MDEKQSTLTQLQLQQVLCNDLVSFGHKFFHVPAGADVAISQPSREKILKLVKEYQGFSAGGKRLGEGL